MPTRQQVLGGGTHGSPDTDRTLLPRSPRAPRSTARAPYRGCRGHVPVRQRGLSHTAGSGRGPGDTRRAASALSSLRLQKPLFAISVGGARAAGTALTSGSNLSGAAVTTPSVALSSTSGLSAGELAAPTDSGSTRKSRRFHSLSSGSRLRTRSVSSTATCRTRPIPTASSRSLLPTGPSWRPGVGQRPRMRYQPCLNGCFLHRPARATNRAMTSPCWTTSSCWALRRSRRRSPHDSCRHSQRWSHRWTGAAAWALRRAS